MARALRKGYATGVTTGNSTFTITPAADLVDGDWMFVSAAHNGTSSTVTAPTGWVLFGDNTTGGGTNTGTRRFYVWGKRRNGSETSYQFTVSVTNVVVTWAIVYGSGGVLSTSEWLNGGIERRAIYYNEEVAANGTSGAGFKTRAPGVTTPANALLLSFAGEATSATETEAQVTVAGATKWFYVGNQGGAIETLIWSYNDTTAAAKSAPIIYTYPNVQTTNGAAIQIAIPELVETGALPTTLFSATFDSAVTNPLTINTGGVARFEKAVTSARSGSAGQRRVAGTEANHAQSVTPEVFTPSGLGYRLTGYVRIDTTTTPSLAGLTVGADSSGNGGIQALIDTRNGQAAGAAGGTSALQLRTGMSSSPLAASGANFAPVSGAWYRIEMDWFSGSPSVKARFYEDATNRFLGALEGGTTVTSGAVGIYGYGSASYDDITLQTIVAPQLGVRLKFTSDGSTMTTGRLTYFDGGKQVPVLSARAIPYGKKLDRLFEKPFVMAHRGGSLDYAEMSMRGYTESVALGAMGLEFSVARSSDGVFFGLHDADLNRTSPSLGSTSFKPGEHTWAEISALSVVVGTGDGRFGPQPYMKLEDMLNTYARSHTIFIDPKVVGNANIGPLIEYLQTFPDYQNTFVGKYFHSGFVEVGRKFRAAGMKTWGYYYFDDLYTTVLANGQTLKTPNIQTTNSEWDFLGLEYGAPQAAWDEVLSYGKPVIGHITPNGAAALMALSKGASGVMASGIRSVMAARAW